MNGVPKGIRTPVTAVKGRCPRPLDDRDVFRCEANTGALGEIRTPDPLVRSQILYPAELRVLILFGFELYAVLKLKKLFLMNKSSRRHNFLNFALPKTQILRVF